MGYKAQIITTRQLFYWLSDWLINCWNDCLFNRFGLKPILNRRESISVSVLTVSSLCVHCAPLRCNEYTINLLQRSGQSVFRWVRNIAKKRLLASSSLSVIPHGTTRDSLDGFTWNLKLEYFSKIYPGRSRFINMTRITDSPYDDQYTFIIISRSILRITGNLTDNIYRGNHNTRYMFDCFCRKSCVSEPMWKNR